MPRAACRTRIDEVGAARGPFCRHYRIASVAELPALKYRDAMDRLASDPGLAQRLAAQGGPIESLPDHAAKLVSIYDEVCGGA